MNARSALWLTLLVGCAETAPQRSTAPPSTPPVEPAVVARLITDAAELAPGATFRVGALVEVDDGWHVYWENPGDAGLPTRLELDLPSGLRAGDVRYPGPGAFLSPGDIVSYGYDDDVVLVADVTVDAADASTTLTAEVSWLACKDLCIPGRESIILELPVDAEKVANGRALLDRHAARLPRPLSDLHDLTTAWRSSDGHAVLTLALADAGSVRFFPSRTDAYVGHAQPAGEPGSVEVTFTLAPDDAAELPARQGVLRVERTGATTYHDVALPWPTGDPS